MARSFHEASRFSNNRRSGSGCVVPPLACIASDDPQSILWCLLLPVFLLESKSIGIYLILFFFPFFFFSFNYGLVFEALYCNDCVEDSERKFRIWILYWIHKKRRFWKVWISSRQRYHNIFFTLISRFYVCFFPSAAELLTYLPSWVSLDSYKIVSFFNMPEMIHCLKSGWPLSQQPCCENQCL